MKGKLKKVLGVVICLAIVVSVVATRASAVSLPILMYHNITTDASATNAMTITEERFRMDMEFLRAYGYTALLPEDLVAIKNGTKQMPSKPVVITFDDGYVSNYTMAYPILLENDMKAAIALVTKNIQTDENNNPESVFMSWQQVSELSQTGVIEFGLHSHNLHNPQTGGELIKNGVNGVERLKGETYIQYAARAGADLTTGLQLLREHTGKKTVNYYSYPYGASDRWMERLLTENGVAVSSTTRTKTADISGGLRMLPRYGIGMHKSVSQLLQEKSTAQPSSVVVQVGEKKQTLISYIINGNNYVRLRDAAVLLKDTGLGFNVAWDAQRHYVVLMASKAYNPLGTEGQALVGGSKTVSSLVNPTVVNGQATMIVAYNIDGNTFYRLRSLGDACGFSSSWDAGTKTITIS